jgi:putative membrane protein
MYLWIKAFHLVAVISWMAGLLYLPRLYVYHAAAEPSSDKAMVFALMERRLLKIIMTPAMVASITLGMVMATLMPELLHEGWFIAKTIVVLGLAGVHGKFAMMRKDFEIGQNIKSEQYYRLWNEVPTVLMIIIVVLAVVRPF